MKKDMTKKQKPSEQVAKIVERLVDEQVNKFKKQSIMQPDLALTEERERVARTNMLNDPGVLGFAILEFLDKEWEKR